ncbi:unnamed protein product, partial [Discosporangium mesarthrocarpum]
PPPPPAYRLSRGGLPMETVKMMNHILRELKKQDKNSIFQAPVPKDLAKYHEIIKHPMDLGTVHKRVESYT